MGANTDNRGLNTSGSTASPPAGGLGTTPNSNLAPSTPRPPNLISDTMPQLSDGLKTFDPSSPTYAADTWARISRADWDKYKHMYQPVEDFLISRLNNPTYNQQQLKGNMAAFDSSQAAGVAGEQRQMKGYGLSLNPQQQQSFDRQANVQKGLGEVESYNRTNRGLADLQYQILGMGQRPNVTPQNPPLS